jgi:GxxExxY protein
VNEKAMMIEFDLTGLNYKNQSLIEVMYFEHNIGYFNSDFLVEDKVIVELKAKETFSEDDPKQLINYLKASKLEVGLLLNFGKKPEVKRKIFTNNRKKI